MSKPLTPSEQKKISKFLSYVLRHHPELIGIELDANGWTSVEELIKKSHEFGITFDLETLQFIVETNSKKRFAFNENFGLIRASQGHSISIELGYTPQCPPLKLFHGTALANKESILKNGIQKQSRQHVHLSSNIETAAQVGGRHGKPFVFNVLSGQMHKDGFTFYLSDNQVWLTDSVPPQYLEF